MMKKMKWLLLMMVLLLVPALGINATEAEETCAHLHVGGAATKATKDQDGYETYSCLDCGKIFSNIVYPQYCKIMLLYVPDTYPYSGKKIVPMYALYNVKGDWLTEGTDYEVTYEGDCTSIGTHYIKVKGINNYDFEDSLAFHIIESGDVENAQISSDGIFTADLPYGAVSYTIEVPAVNIAYDSGLYCGGFVKSIKPFNVFELLDENNVEPGEYKVILKAYGTKQLGTTCEVYFEYKLKNGNENEDNEDPNNQQPVQPVQPTQPTTENKVTQELGPVDPSAEITTVSPSTTPKAPVIAKIKKNKKKIVISWKKQAKSDVDGYQIQYSTKKNFKSNVKTIKVVNGKKNYRVIKRKKLNKKYYIRIRSYKKVDGKTYFSTWVKTKKAK